MDDAKEHVVHMECVCGKIHSSVDIICIQCEIVNIINDSYPYFNTIDIISAMNGTMLNGTVLIY